MSSYFIPLSGLSSASTAIDMVGNNLANLNTTGYKTTDASFEDMISQQIGFGAAGQLGMGVVGPQILHQFTQGTLQTTNSPFDAAIQGNGFFVVKNTQGSTLYTRAGNFQVDQNGNLITATGEFVQGYTAAGGVLNPSGAVSNITIPSGSLQIPIPTSQFSINTNLDATTAVNGTFSTPVQVVDSLGNTHTLTVTFTNTAAGAWSYNVTIPGEDIKGGTAGTPQSVATGNVTFGPSGNLLTPAASAGTVAVKIANLADGASNSTVNWNLYNTSGNSTLTQFAATSATSGTTQDGNPAAQPTNVQLGANGAVVAQYANGTSVTIAQVALANIQNPESMLAVGNNEFQVGPDTVTPTVGAANSGGRGQIIPGSLENSTVDIATQFTDMMVFQRAYQADSRVISTVDQMVQDLLNIPR